MRPSGPAGTAGAVFLLVLSVILLAASTGLGVLRTDTYVNGTVVTAHVTSCQTRLVRGNYGSHTETVCQGEWTTSDDRRHTGEIDGAHQSDENSDIRIRTNGDQAIVDSPRELWPLALIPVTLAATVLVAVRLRSRLRRRPR